MYLNLTCLPLSYVCSKFINVFVGVFIYVEFVRTCSVFTHLLFTPTYRNEASRVPDFIWCVFVKLILCYLFLFSILKKRKEMGRELDKTTFWNMHLNWLYVLMSMARRN